MQRVTIIARLPPTDIRCTVAPQVQCKEYACLLERVNKDDSLCLFSIVSAIPTLQDKEEGRRKKRKEQTKLKVAFETVCADG